MANVNAIDDARHLLVFKLDGRRDKMEFIRGFPGVAERFGFTEIIYGGRARPGAGDELAEARAEWDRLNRLALEKLRFYVSMRVDQIVTDGEDLTAREYYQRLHRLFLRIGGENVSTLHLRLAACKYVEGEEVFAWLGRLGAIFAQFHAAGAPIQDLDKKHRAMSLIAEARTWGAMSHLLGTGDGVSYEDWKTAMLAKEEEFEQNGAMSGQQLANDLYGHKDEHEGAFPATTLHQTYRGSGFGYRGSAYQRGGFQRAQGQRAGQRGRGGYGGNRVFGRDFSRGTGLGGRNERGRRGANTSFYGRQQAQGRMTGATRSEVCYNCGEGGHIAAHCYARGNGTFNGYCNNCGEWGHQMSQCPAQRANISTDEFEAGEDGYPYNPNSDYYDSYSTNSGDHYEEKQHGVYNLMIRVLNEHEDKALVATYESNLKINLDSYCTRHMTPCYELQDQEPCVVNIMVGNKEILQSTHKGSLRLGHIVFQDVLFVPGLLQTLISEPQLELRGCKIVSERGVRTISRNGKYLFHAILERNSYVFKPESLSTNSRVYTSEEVALMATPASVGDANLWHLRLGHLNFGDMCKLKSRATGIAFEGEICFCETCVLSKMRASPFQNKGHRHDLRPKQNICYDVSGPYPPTVEGYIYSFNAICKKTGKRWRGAGKHKSESAPFLRDLINRLNNTVMPPGKVETLTTDHGGEVVSTHFQQWLKDQGVFHLTAPRGEPNYNAVIERSSAVVENMAFAMLKHASRPKSWWNMAFDYATHVLDRCPRRSNERSVTPFEAFFRQKPDVTDLRIFGCLCYAHVSPDEHHHLEPRAQRGVFVGFDEERRSVRVVVDGQRKFTVHRSVVWYEQPLLDTMTRCAHSAYSDQQPILDMPTARNSNSASSDASGSREIQQHLQTRQRSSTEHENLPIVAAEKQHKRQAEISKKDLLLSPIPAEIRVPPTPPAKLPKQAGKYSRIKRELSLAIQKAGVHTVCSVTILDFFDIAHQQCQANETLAASGNGQSFETPRTVSQALQHEDAEYWKSAMLDELANHEEIFQSYGPPIQREPGMKATPTRFLFSKKVVSLEERQQDKRSKAYKPMLLSTDYERFRARLLYVNNQFTSEQSSWEELFAPVVDKTSVRIFLTVCAMFQKHVIHLDVVSAYLHANLTGPARYITLWGDEKNVVRQLFKAVNGIDNAAQIWNKHYNKFMLAEGFVRSSRDNCLYIHPDSSVQSSLYVDDILASADPDKKEELDRFVKKVQKEFIVRILGEPKKFLGMEITYLRDQRICCVSQQAYIEKLAHTFLLEPVHAPTTPVEANVYDKLRMAQDEPDFEGPYRSIVGGLLFIFVCTRMDIGFAVSLLTQNLAKPKPTHFLLAKRVLAYLVGTKSFGLILGGQPSSDLSAFVDASFANDQLDRKSMGGYIVFLGNSPCSWSAKKHRGIVALSSTETEIVQVTEGLKEVLWMQPLLIDIGFPNITSTTVMHEDNQPASQVLLKGPTHSARTKHMDVRVKFCGEVLAQKNRVLLKYIPTKWNFADIFTKPLHTVRFRDLRSIMVHDLTGIINNSQFLQRTFSVLTDFVQSPFKSPSSSMEQTALY